MKMFKFGESGEKFKRGKKKRQKAGNRNMTKFKRQGSHKEETQFERTFGKMLK